MPGQLFVVVSSPDDLAGALWARRRQLRLPLRVVGDRAGMSFQQVWEVEKGRVRPGPDVLLRVAGALSCDVALLLHESTGPLIYR